MLQGVYGHGAEVPLVLLPSGAVPAPGRHAALLAPPGSVAASLLGEWFERASLRAVGRPHSWWCPVAVLRWAVARYLPRRFLGCRGSQTLVSSGPTLAPPSSGDWGADLPVPVPAHGVPDAEGCPAVPLPVQLV